MTPRKLLSLLVLSCVSVLSLQCSPDSSCEPEGNAIAVSCEPFPATLVCAPFGVWSLAYDAEFPGKCYQPAIDSVSIERDSDGIVRVSYGVTSSATLAPDGCVLSVASTKDWSNHTENGTLTHSLTLTFDPVNAAPTATGELTYSESGFCSGSGTTKATATRLTK